MISGLDSIEACQWLNAMVCSLVPFDEDGDPNMNTIMPVIDRGSKAFKGQARVILPFIASCFKCVLDAQTLRLPEQHCISYAFMPEVCVWMICCICFCSSSFFFAC